MAGRRSAAPSNSSSTSWESAVRSNKGIWRPCSSRGCSQPGGTRRIFRPMTLTSPLRQSGGSPDGHPAHAGPQQVLVVAAGRLGEERLDLVLVAGVHQRLADSAEHGEGVAVLAGQLDVDVGVADLIWVHRCGHARLLGSGSVRAEQAGAAVNATGV